MLFEAYGQFSVFLVFIWFGFIAAFIYGLLKPQKFAAKVIFDFAFFSLCGILFVCFVHKYNMGQVRLFLFIGVALGLLLEIILLSKTLESFRKLLYNYLAIFLTKVKRNYLNNLPPQNNINNKTIKKRKLHLPKRKKALKTQPKPTKLQ